MPTLMPSTEQIRQRIIELMPGSVRAFLQRGPQRELLKQIDATLLIFDDHLVHVETGNSAAIGIDGQDPDARALALAARTLLRGRRSKEGGVLLLLPPCEFLATRCTMPGVNPEGMMSALKLQTETLLPACEDPLELAINPASAEAGGDLVGLWIPRRRMNELFLAFSERELLLAAVKPRVLHIPEHDGKLRVLDYDRTDATAVVTRNGVVQRWLQVNSIDFEQEVFASQWQRQVHQDGELKTDELRDIAGYLRRLGESCHPEYSFFPEGAIRARKKVEKGKRLLVAAAASVVLVLLSLVPFIGQTFELSRISAALEASREMTADVRQNRQAVEDFENEWGVITGFPRQDVRDAMFALQEVLSPEQLTQMEISEGVIEIQGISQNPQAILQRLQSDPLFTDVIFSRATNNDRYFIDLRLSTVDFESYLQRHFPDA